MFGIDHQNINEVLYKKIQDILERDEIELFNEKSKTVNFSYEIDAVLKKKISDRDVPECAICISNIEDPHDICVFENCKHMFCVECSYELQKRNHIVPCPICRTITSRNDIVPFTESKHKSNVNVPRTWIKERSQKWAKIEKSLAVDFYHHNKLRAKISRKYLICNRIYKGEKCNVPNCPFAHSLNDWSPRSCPLGSMCKRVEKTLSTCYKNTCPTDSKVDHHGVKNIKKYLSSWDKLTKVHNSDELHMCPFIHRKESKQSLQTRIEVEFPISVISYAPTETIMKELKPFSSENAWNVNINPDKFNENDELQTGNVVLDNREEVENERIYLRGGGVVYRLYSSIVF